LFITKKKNDDDDDDEKVVEELNTSLLPQKLSILIGSDSDILSRTKKLQNDK